MSPRFCCCGGRRAIRPAGGAVTTLHADVDSIAAVGDKLVRMPNEEAAKEIFHVAGNVPDPGGTGVHGISPGHTFTNVAIGHPLLIYKTGADEGILEADVYKLPGQPMYIHLVCPKCLARGVWHGLKITEGQKQFHFELEAPPTWPGWSRVNMRSAIARDIFKVEPHQIPHHWGGTLSCMPFECSFEAEPEPGREFSFSKCGWRVCIDNNVVRDVR